MLPTTDPRPARGYGWIAITLWGVGATLLFVLLATSFTWLLQFEIGQVIFAIAAAALSLKLLSGLIEQKAVAASPTRRI